MLRFLSWIDQTKTDWFKASSAAIRAVKITVEERGFGLPEPIYRVRFDSGSPLEIARGVSTSVSSQGKAKNLGVIVIRRPCRCLGR